MKKLIKLFMSALLLVAVASCDDTNKVDYVKPVEITFDNVGSDNTIQVDSGVRYYKAKISLTSTRNIRTFRIYEIDPKTGARGMQITKDTAILFVRNDTVINLPNDTVIKTINDTIVQFGIDTVFNPTVKSYTTQFILTKLTTNKGIEIVVEDEELMSFSKKILVKITRDMFESGVVTIESSEAFFGPYYASWLSGRSYISIDARKYANEVDFSFGNIAITGTDTVAALVSPDKREELGLPFIPGMRSCKFELTTLTAANFNAIPPTDGSVIRALTEPTQSVLKAEAGKIYSYENNTEKGLIYIASLQSKKGPLQQQDGSWVQNQTFHQLKVITKTVMKE